MRMRNGKIEMKRDIVVLFSSVIQLCHMNAKSTTRIIFRNIFEYACTEYLYSWKSNRSCNTVTTNRLCNNKNLTLLNIRKNTTKYMLCTRPFERVFFCFSIIYFPIQCAMELIYLLLIALSSAERIKQNRLKKLPWNCVKRNLDSTIFLLVLWWCVRMVNETTWFGSPCCHKKSFYQMMYGDKCTRWLVERKCLLL